MARLVDLVHPAVLVAGVVLLVVAVLVAVAWLGQRRLIYLPHPSRVPLVAEALPGARAVELVQAAGAPGVDLATDLLRRGYS
jgi:hypothetical protein